MSRIEKPFTFVGPITQTSIKDGHRTWGFRLMQVGGDPISLEYPSRDEAKVARKQLIRTTAHAVPTLVLFSAIVEALKQAVSGVTRIT